MQYKRIMCLLLFALEAMVYDIRVWESVYIVGLEAELTNFIFADILRLRGFQIQRAFMALTWKKHPYVAHL